jgi:hypothetical protein
VVEKEPHHGQGSIETFAVGGLKVEEAEQVFAGVGGLGRQPFQSLDDRIGVGVAPAGPDG